MQLASDGHTERYILNYVHNYVHTHKGPDMKDGTKVGYED